MGLTKFCEQPTCVKSNSHVDPLVGHVPYLEVPCGAKQVQSHGGDLTRVTVAIGNRKSRHHHVCITYCFNLRDREEKIGANYMSRV